MSNEKLEKEIEELENEIFGTDDVTPEVDPTGDLPNEEPVDPEPKDTLDNLVDPEPVDPEPVEPNSEPNAKPKKYTNWKKRYKDLQSYSDSRFNDIMLQNKELQVAVSDLQDKLNSIPVSIDTPDMETYFNETSKELLGDSTIKDLSAATKKMIAANIEPLQKELVEERKRRLDLEKANLKNVKSNNYNYFIGKLEELAPGFSQLNKDPGFLNYLNNIDTYSGKSYSILLREAEARQDVVRVAQFFNAYSDALKPKTDKLKEQVAPNATPSTKTNFNNIKERVWKESEIDKIYNAIKKGIIFGKKEAQLTDEIDTAVMTGRVQYGI